MTTKPRTRNRSSKADGIGRTPIGASETVKSLMVFIDWTQWREGKTVPVTALKDVVAKAFTIDTRTGEVLHERSLKMCEGITYYFVASSFEGWYYVGRVSGAGRASCDCAHCQCTKPKECKHQAAILASHQSRIERQNRGIAAVFVDVSAQIEQDAEEHKLEATQEELSIEAKMCLYKFDLEGRSFESLKRMAIEKGLSACRGKKGYVWQLVQRYRNELLRAPVVAVDLCVGA